MKTSGWFRMLAILAIVLAACGIAALFYSRVHSDSRLPVSTRYEERQYYPPDYEGRQTLNLYPEGWEERDRKWGIVFGDMKGERPQPRRYSAVERAEMAGATAVVNGK